MHLTRLLRMAHPAILRRVDPADDDCRRCEPPPPLAGASPEIPRSRVDAAADRRLLEPPLAGKFPPSGWGMVVVGHRGMGANVAGGGRGGVNAVRENTLLSFARAAEFVGFVEFDVQVTKDDRPIIFHDYDILTQEAEGTVERRITDLNLDEFLLKGLQKESGQVPNPLLRQAKDGTKHSWSVEDDDSFCMLQEAFECVNPCIGFNIELKFDNNIDDRKIMREA